MIKCRICDQKAETPEQEKNFDLHHIIPKFMEGTDKDGRIYLCKKCHETLHKKIPIIILKYVPESLRTDLKQDLKTYTLKQCQNHK